MKSIAVDLHVNEDGQLVIEVDQTVRSGETATGALPVARKRSLALAIEVILAQVLPKLPETGSVKITIETTDGKTHTIFEQMPVKR